jgi:hypothetical protein
MGTHKNWFFKPKAQSPIEYFHPKCTQKGSFRIDLYPMIPNGQRLWKNPDAQKKFRQVLEFLCSSIILGRFMKVEKISLPA